MESESRNIYRTGRQVAGLTQERWAEAIGVSVDSVRNYEAGTQIPSDEVVRAMSEISGLSPLSYWHLCRKSTLAAEMLPEVEAIPLPQAVCALLRAMREFEENHHDSQLIAIAADGQVDEMERAAYECIAKTLESVVQAALQLKYAEGGNP